MEKYIFSPRASTQSSATPNAQKSIDLNPNPKFTSEFKVPTPRSHLKQFIDLEGDNTGGTSSKRKPIRKSPAWEHFKLAEDDPKNPNSICNYCRQSFACSTEKYGTSTMLKHLNRCRKNPFRVQDKKTKIAKFSS